MRGPQNSCRTLPQPENSPLGPKKVKNDPKIKSNQMSELKETKKIKVVQLHEETSKQFLNLSQNLKIAH